MYKEIVRNYISKLTLKDLEVFANNHDIIYNNDELVIVYQFIKNHYDDLLDENIKVFEEIKSKISPTLYKKLLNLYIEYKQKYIN